MTPIVEINALHFSYVPSDPILKDVNLTIDEGEFASIIGPNGGGKTTLVRLILGLLSPDRGTVTLFGGDPVKNRLLVGYTPQQIQVDRLFPISVLDVVLSGALGSPGKRPKGLNRFLFRYRPSDYDAAWEALERMELTGEAKKAFGDLSGGQRQRVLIARSICARPKLLILDEPTNNIDPSGSEILYRLLKELNRSTSILIVSHDLGVVSRYVQSVICVNRHVVVHPTSALNGTAIREIYGSDQYLVRHDHRCSEQGHHHFDKNPE